MVCDICGKNQATVHLTEIIDDQMSELHLCEECARQKSVQMEQQFGLSDLLAGLADFGKHIEGKEISKVRCPNCNLSYDDFKKIGRLGCSSCYSAFAPHLIPLLKRIHGSIVHTGKVQKGIPFVEVAKKAEPVKAKFSLGDLRNKLQEAIRLENFEEAAKLRDKIKELEKKMSQSSDEQSENLDKKKGK
jgi:protein arginine kinase activator